LYRPMYSRAAQTPPPYFKPNSFSAFLKFNQKSCNITFGSLLSKIVSSVFSTNFSKERRTYCMAFQWLFLAFSADLKVFLRCNLFNANLVFLFQSSSGVALSLHYYQLLPFVFSLDHYFRFKFILFKRWGLNKLHV